MITCLHITLNLLHTDINLENKCHPSVHFHGINSQTKTTNRMKCQAMTEEFIITYYIIKLFRVEVAGVSKQEISFTLNKD